ncbi:hypothetical protein [Ancylomarina sp. 16SWW S1-10-2]|uniref:hypothetical protein n=1 Tax=Ancylomarina sp. 16SWW S1-10-2 TaxID=2499681 RepID=UPI0012AEAB75|nr:hypothetical protein [Ancylomarina sp. 16SWW S1-10-2]MRT91817.1 hypothetical protein [Ancylomarina sp. 16SWW S1-10-2]
MKFEKNLLDQKSSAKTIIGLLGIILIVIWVSSKFYIEESFETFDFVNLILLFLLAMVFIFEGRGIRLASIIGKAFILIDEEQISLKKSVFSKKQTILWEDIKSIEYKPNYFLFTKQDDSLFPLKLKQQAYRFNREVLDFIKIIGKHKNIEVERMNDFRKK